MVNIINIYSWFTIVKVHLHSLLPQAAYDKARIIYCGRNQESNK